MAYNKSLKPTVTRVTPFAEMAKLAPRYGGLVPPFYPLKCFLEKLRIVFTWKLCNIITNLTLYIFILIPFTLLG